MTHLRIHLVYLAVIGFLTYQYWAKTQALNEAVTSIEQFDKLLKIDTKAVDRASIMLKNEISKQVRAYINPINMLFSKKASNAVETLNSVNDWFEKQKKEFTHFCGGFDKKDSSLLANSLSSKASNQFFTNIKIQEIQDSLAHYQTVLSDISDKRSLYEVEKFYTLPNRLKNDVYWQSLKNKTNADGLAQLSVMQNEMQLDLIPFLNYLYNIIGSDTDIRFDAFKVVIAPQKGVLMEDETFKADIYLTPYISNPSSNITFIVNDEKLPIKDGLVHFEKTENNVGKKNIKATALIKNPLTGQLSSYFGELEYEVLPKCSRDCK